MENETQKVELTIITAPAIQSGGQPQPTDGWALSHPQHYLIQPEDCSQVVDSRETQAWVRHLDTPLAHAIIGLEKQMYYFAYGANLSRKQMSELCPDARPRFGATLPGYQLIFTGRGSRKSPGGQASIKRIRGEKVMGSIYEITERCLRALDSQKSYPSLYNRANVVVFTGLDEPVEAITHVKVEQSEETAPSKEYLLIIRQGYQDWGLI